jgi:hypothetical protein
VSLSVARAAGRADATRERPGHTGYAAMQAAFDEAAERRGGAAWLRRLSLAGTDVPISVVGETLADIAAEAFAHLLRPRSTPAQGGELSIALWDRSATGISAPPRPSSEEWTSEGAGWRIDAHDDLRFTREERPESVIWCDRATGSLVAMFADARDLLLYEKARPLSRRIPDICRHLGALDVHAAAVASHVGAALIVGGSGRGKSSTSLDCLAGGLQFLGDDSVGITGGDCGFTAHSLYASARVHPHQTARWQQFASFWIAPGVRDDKSLLMPMTVPGACVVASAPVRAIVIPRVGDGPVSFQPARRSQAFHALVTDSVENLRFSLSREQFQRFTRLTQSLPAYSLQIGPDPAAVADAVAGIIKESAE